MYTNDTSFPQLLSENHKIFLLGYVLNSIPYISRNDVDDLNNLIAIYKNLCSIKKTQISNMATLSGVNFTHKIYLRVIVIYFFNWFNKNSVAF